MIPPHPIDTSKPEPVAEALKYFFEFSATDESADFIDHAVFDVAKMYRGDWPGYQAIDMEYHDLDHTYQVTVCMLHLLEGRRLTSDKPVFSDRDCVLAMLAALMHDTGFLKECGDDVGSGAKYTFVHEKRSCAFARKYLPTIGLLDSEIEDICSAVMCTGPRNDISNVAFAREEARHMAVMLVTADYLAQMSAGDYLEKLPRLYSEFVEAFEVEGVPVENRPYKSLHQLLEMTTGFWEKFVLPLLEGKLEKTYRYLAPEGSPNPYIKAVEANLAELRSRLSNGTV